MDDFIVCRCEDVTIHEVLTCGDESGVIDISEAKRRLRIGMGVCQGRICGPLLERCFGGAAVGTLQRNAVLRPVLLSEIAGSDDSGASSSETGASGTDSSTTGTSNTISGELQ